MNWPVVLKILGVLFVMQAAAMLVPLGVAFYFDDGGIYEFSLGALIPFIIGTLLYFRYRKDAGQLRTRSAILVVGSAWISMTVFGAIPFYLSGDFAAITQSEAVNASRSLLVDAWFESASGFTTTGASVLGNIEGLPHAMLLWRSLTQFLGGMGIIVLSLAILPLLGVGGMQVYKAEVPGPTTDKLTARVSETARALWIVYVAFVLVEALLLYYFGMTPFDAINHSMTTMATGGFSTKNSSIGSFNSVAIEMVITVFMFLAGVNFLLHYRLLAKREFVALKDREFRFYISIIAACIVVVTVSIWGANYQSFTESLRYTVFNVVSLVSTTGFGTADFKLWTPFAQMVIIVLMVSGGSAGSTSGGIKCIRVMMLLKQGYRELYRLIHPKAVTPLKLGRNAVSEGVASAIFGYFFLYITLLGVTSLLITASGVDIVTAATGVISALSNIGPGLGEIGPALNYGNLPDLAKLLLSACMVVGRLEIFTILVLFTSEFWRG